MSLVYFWVYRCVSHMVTQVVPSPPRNGIGIDPPDDSLLLIPWEDFSTSGTEYCPFYYHLQAELLNFGYSISCTLVVLERVPRILNLCQIGTSPDRAIRIPFLPVVTFDALFQSNFHLFRGENLKQKSKPTSGGGTVGGGG